MKRRPICLALAAALAVSVLLTACTTPSETPPAAIAPAPQPAAKPATPPALQNNFDASDQLPAGWTAQGSVSIDAQNAFKGKGSLLLSRLPADVEKPCTLTTAEFPVTPGIWQISLAARSDLKSPDASFDARITLQLTDAAGKKLDPQLLFSTYGQHAWQPIAQRIDIPDNAASAHIHVELEKASGRFWIDELSAAFISATVHKDHRIDRMMFNTAQMGNLLFPTDSRKVTVTVLATKPLDDKQLTLSYAVRDYWGAEIAPPAQTTLAPAGDSKGKLQYTATIDLSAVPLELGRYYEIQAEVPQLDDEPFKNYTSLAILPEAPANAYRPEQIPFTLRNWGSNIHDFVYLGHRIGVRDSSVADPDICKELDLGAITGVEGLYQIERMLPGWQKFTPDVLRANTKKSLAKADGIKPMLLTLGNEPPVLVDHLPAVVAAEKVVYEEVKKLDPSITVISTSIGPSEEFFKAGFHHYCDVVDFHGYSDWREVKEAFDHYHDLFAKYGDPKPIWSTEIGLNAQGLPRQTIAITMVKKLTSFFACGGACVSWFDLGWPDPDAKIANDPTSAFNVFDCRYAPRYCPKLDAVTYYNMINGISDKKFVAQKLYGTDTYAFLFRDADHHCLQVLWKEKGRQDVSLALPGVGKVTAINIDGRRTELDAGGTALTLTINEDPLLLLYDSADALLAENLGPPDVAIATVADGVVKGESAPLMLNLANAKPEQIALVLPAFWTAAPVDDLAGKVTGNQLAFAITTPAITAARQGDIAVLIKNASGGYSGLLRARIAVNGRVTAQLEPNPASADQPAGVRLVLKNFAPDKQDVKWKLELTGEMPMEKGRYEQPVNTAAYFGETPEGALTLDGKQSTDIIIPLAGTDPLNIYRVKATVTDASGRSIITERFMGGFLRVPHTTAPIKLDALSAADWTNVPIANLNDARQYYSMKPTAQWKGPDDLSATMQYQWDEHYLYVRIAVRDDIFVQNKVDGAIWAGDGLQFLIDPLRDTANKAGKYDLAIAKTRKGNQAWCYLSADSGAPAGEVKDITMQIEKTSPDRGDMTYLLAIPWSRVGPFKPLIGANLGLALVINEDDGPGRALHIDWFGDIESKSTDNAGDLILEK